MPELQELSVHLVGVIPAKGGDGVTMFVGGKETSVLFGGDATCLCTALCQRSPSLNGQFDRLLIDNRHFDISCFFLFDTRLETRQTKFDFGSCCQRSESRNPRAHTPTLVAKLYRGGRMQAVGQRGQS